MMASTAPKLEPFNKEIRLVSSIGMYMTLISIGMLFLTLFLGYAFFRLQNEVWPPAGLERPALDFPLLSTMFATLSSLFMYTYQRNDSRTHFSLSFIFGLSFLGSQYFLWESLKDIGYFAGSGVFSSLIYAFTWTHAGHIFLGLILFLSLALMNFFSVGKERISLYTENFSRFWHFLTIIWFLIFIVLFLI